MRFKDALMVANAAGFGTTLCAAGQPRNGRAVASPFDCGDLPEWEIPLSAAPSSRTPATALVSALMPAPSPAPVLAHACLPAPTLAPPSPRAPPLGPALVSGRAHVSIPNFPDVPGMS